MFDFEIDLSKNKDLMETSEFKILKLFSEHLKKFLPENIFIELEHVPPQPYVDVHILMPYPDPDDCQYQLILNDRINQLVLLKFTYNLSKNKINIYSPFCGDIIHAKKDVELIDFLNDIMQEPKLSKAIREFVGSHELHPLIFKI